MQCSTLLTALHCTKYILTSLHCTKHAMGKPAGRQPLPKAERRSERIFVYVTPAEYRAVKTHRKRGQTISDFVRDAIIAALRPTPEPSPPPAGGGSHVADPPHTAHGGGPAHGGPRSMGPSSQHRASPQPQHGAPGAHQAQGGSHVADPPHTAHGGGPAHGGPRSMGPSSQHRASPQPQHGAPGAHQAQGSPHIADPPPSPHTAPSQQQPAPAVTAEEVKRRLTQAGVEGWKAFTAADKDPQRVADILGRSGGLSPGAIFNRIVRPGA